MRNFKTRFPQLIGVMFLLWIPASGYPANPPLSPVTTRERTVLPVVMPPGTPPNSPSNVSQYITSGYGTYSLGPGVDEGPKFLRASGGARPTHQARLLSFFSISDIHITDKESPAQVPYLGWSAGFTNAGLGGLNPASYSPAILDSTHHLDAAVRTINALHRSVPFHFGICLGDTCNSSQYNELRWFIDVMDGQQITPSSGIHAGADIIDYQKPYQAAGLDRSIPWYEAIGNHDQFWMGVGYPTDKVRRAYVGDTVLNISTGGPLIPPGSEGSGVYVGVVDGSTPYGTVVQWGPTNLFKTPPKVAADPTRRTITADVSSPTAYVEAFFNTTTLPKGHGFTRTNTGSLAACYAFEPLANMPIKVIVLDDTCKSNAPAHIPTFYGAGWVDAARYAWLTNELQKGQDADQLMIVATHVPMNPQADLYDTNRASALQFYFANDAQAGPGFHSETNMIATFHQYPNLMLLMSGHRHKNVVTPHPSPDPAHPERGFWQVETPSLRDFPRQFRTWEILRNSDNAISIVTTDVDPMVEVDSPAWKSLGYAVGAARIFGEIGLDDAASHAYNAELVKELTPRMQARVARLAGP